MYTLNSAPAVQEMKLKISIPPYPICGCLDLDKKVIKTHWGQNILDFNPESQKKYKK